MSTSQTNANEASGGRWWKAILLLICVVAAIGAGTTFISGATTQRDNGPKLTHTIKRDNLRVTVTEQGTLESSNNTEIKCRVKGVSTVLWVIETGTNVKPGDELVRLDTSTIEENINTQKIAYERAVATYAQSEADEAVAKIAIKEYVEGTYRSQMKTLKKDLAIAESNLSTAKNMLQHSKRMFKRGYISELEVEGNEFSVEQGQLELELKNTEIDVLERFTREKELETLKAALKTASAKLNSDKAALDLEEARLKREESQLENCIIKAESSGMVIYPSAAEWKEQPDIEEGASVRQDQILLMIPDLTQMQVKVGIHESKVDRVTEGLPAIIEMQDLKIQGEVASVSQITKPAGWWTGNVVKYDTIVKLDSQEGLKPGMSAGVEVVIAEHVDVLTIPVAAVLEQQENEFVCWVKTTDDIQRRSIQLGDSNDQFIVVEGGLKEGDEVVLNPLAFVDDAQINALKPVDPDKTTASNGAVAEIQSSPNKPPSNKSTEPKNSAKAKKQSAAKPQVDFSQIMKVADKNADGVLTIDEYAEKDRKYFSLADKNGDEQVDLAELETAVKALMEAGGK